MNKPVPKKEFLEAIFQLRYDIQTQSEMHLLPNCDKCSELPRGGVEWEAMTITGLCEDCDEVLTDKV